jgi:hypothetical protein
LYKIFIDTPNTLILNIEYPPAMQSAERWIEISAITSTLKCYRKSAERHCGQVEQGISNFEVWHRSRGVYACAACRSVFLFQ